MTEHFLVQIPKDGELNHQLRYQALPGEKADIYVKVGNDWRKVRTEEFGGYQLFDTSGNTVEFAASVEKNPYTRYIMIGAVCAASGPLLLVLAAFIRKKKRHRND
ncbi:MAG: hypothetical protein K6C41_05730 [Lachnospiraceae bacterium]|nr:hypothetical protein [Lachnospiraceae bacterium]